MSKAAVLQREVFSTSRLLEFFSEKELQMQIGFSREGWPIALLKELIDNSLDACESAGVRPTIEVTIDADAVSVRDNGPGIPADTLQRSLDFSTRTSDKAHYVSPSRGQLGNALKCLWTAGYVISGEIGSIEVHADGTRHSIEVKLDQIAQQPTIEHTKSLSFVNTGTLVRFGWEGIASFLNRPLPGVFYKGVSDLLSSYSALNPHASFWLMRGEAMEPGLQSYDSDFKKWTPSENTSAHWYDLERFQSLIAAYVNSERTGTRTRTVREFVAEFRGFSGSAKQKAATDGSGQTGKTLQDLVENGAVSKGKAAILLAALQRESQPVKPAMLGPIGKANACRYLEEFNMAEPGMVEYKAISGDAAGVPFIVEMAVGIYRDEFIESRQPRTEIIGVNWTPALRSPAPILTSLLGEARLDSHDPVGIFVHFITPRASFVDRGKSAMAMPAEMIDALKRCVQKTTSNWKKLKRDADKQDRVNQRRVEEHWNRMKPRKASVKEAAYRLMRECYLLASDNGKLPANARQIMYVARPLIIELSGKISPWKKSSHFTQKLLPDYIRDNPIETADWDVVYDARGHFTEPHTGRSIALGTLNVRDYLAKWGIGEETATPIINTIGPADRYSAVLFVEKEGFNELWRAVKLSERYDLAIMSTKGMSTTSARMLVEELSKNTIPVYVLRDFDKSGFSIVHTLRTSSRRYEFEEEPNVKDLGLRLDECMKAGLTAEPVEYSKGDPRDNLRKNGATPEEINFLANKCKSDKWEGYRVEINAFKSRQLVDWLQGKLDAAGVRKVLPSREALAKAWRTAEIQKRILALAPRIEAEINLQTMPEDLSDTLADHIQGTALSWDEALRELVMRTK